uniref:Uncharacterized protein n=1 Tax=Trieres chinensis TaxID=1514140 RepID=A0A7S1ZV81_TRICV|mmetsp:Transcript_34034/g.69491  ORF Transcript_34034/g.69491 Transcript_34034/m.69491 type:complete len:209 (+) Transcript_34034:85-711(+)|eukprot:CAMPEP_0183307962 /NCGR_PEP_ID=MMETSP0160_2-20130417/19660_1 /TAXON_ID=2839 ORGANISM="Odontella Sinensis, Strain Grunow 1884" /NCGR_SAMPLE_ID=MMETSP0160_2 /ASSEMBLY_ACC=CAM_ASM_000250 /LENGTH=208 /DNA_ID=CAMNT_0025471687 /DNA_START=74 /DNA_END=700 /DNA_ORIENTATION=+
MRLAAISMLSVLATVLDFTPVTAFGLSAAPLQGSKCETSASIANHGGNKVVATDRRTFLTFGLTAASIVTSGAFPQAAVADVSDGNALPTGAKEFSRVLKVKADFANIGKRVAENGDEIDSKEWEKISQYLRTVYSAGEDMKVIAKGMYDPEKKKRAAELIKVVQKAAQAGEIPVSQKNAKGFLVIQEKVIAQLDEFFDLLQDVPDEL